VAYVFTISPRRADLAPGPRLAPELARYDRITAGRNSQPAAVAAGTRDALPVLAGVLDRDGQQLSASQTRQQALADADHLAILHATWTNQTTAAREQHYRDLLIDRLPPEHRRQPGHMPGGCGGPCAPPNWPTWTPARFWPQRSASGTYLRHPTVPLSTTQD
jgi:hypothetical protein